MSKLRVFLADDHPVVREGLKALISAQPDMEVVGEAADGEETVRLATELHPDVVVMDISMPRRDGTAATQDLKRRCPGVKVVALTVHEDRSYVRHVLGAGASGYVVKRTAPEELVTAIRSIAAGMTYVDPSVASEVAARRTGKPPSSVGLSGNALSSREEEVVRRIAQGYSNKEIAAQLEVSVKTVETYKTRSMEKLGLRARHDFVRYAVQRGWLQDT